MPDVQKAQRNALTAVILAHITVDTHTGALPVILPVLLAQFGLSYTSAAAIMSANQIIIAIAQPFFGIWGDKRSYKWLVWLGCLVTGLAMASVLWLPSYWLVIAMVMVSGLGSAAFHPEALSRVRAVSADKAVSATAFFFAGGNIGFALGPILFTLLYTHFDRPGTLLMLVPTMLGLLLLRFNWSPLQQDSPLPVRQGNGSSPLAVVGLVLFLMMLIVLRSSVVGGLQTFIPLYYGQEELLGKERAALLVSLLLVSGVIGTLGGGLLSLRVGRRGMMVGTMLVASVALYIFMNLTGGWQMLAIVVAGAAVSAAWPVIVVMIQEAMPTRVGLASGLSLGTAYGATGLGVAALGALADTVGLAATLTLIGWLPVIILIMSLFVKDEPPR